MMERLVNAAKSYLPDLNEKRLKKAFEFAKMAHGSQERRDGSPYITHPWSAAMILTKLHVDEDTLIACLLHDVPEDTEYSIEDVGERFGSKVQFLVDGITKLSKVHYRNDMESRQVESLKKLFIHNAQDPRIILIKLADRLHNMMTLEAISNPEKRQRIAKETIEIFVPIANLFGIWELKNQLEDWCFKALHPVEYANILEMVNASNYKRQNVLKKTIQSVKKIFKEKHIEIVAIEGREKNIYSIYRKMLRSGKSFRDIYDLIGVRIIVKDVGLCYQVLGVIHQDFRPKIGRLKDYIAIPKNNGYQSIHTTVFGVDGVLTEFQIRTYDMHLENEYGVAAHYFYSNKKKKVSTKTDKKYQWVQRILDLQRSTTNNQKFMEDLKLDIFEDRIFVFTPKGDVVDLPVGSTVIDFAYHIHSDLGMLAVGALVNGKNAPLSTPLGSGDTVLIDTSEESEGPEVEWLNLVHTSLAKTRIREFLKEKNRTDSVQAGEEALDHELKVLGADGVESLTDLQKVMAIEHFSKSSWEELLNDLGQGTLDMRDLWRVLLTEDELMGLPQDNLHLVHLEVQGQNRVGLLKDLTSVLVRLNVNIQSISAGAGKRDQVVNIQLILEIETLSQFERLLKEFRKVPGVLKIMRLRNSALESPHSIHSHKMHDQ
ncbi:bifunctional (p)ppGpp synthetase/guanosine-3',5'-bis(diphosphate) 3'-pyrophosphohydrolase [Candidatus Peregrinibacteria bacterium]|nr:MAG: bifunctional (p)ppGpp synthetase/guanosine-3',5'-bis(diphosphate) 3'-pyrophosphohydrolase [Candidatus Peregrinibacteria bacterium]